MRICSFLPSATEMLFALGLDEEIVGVSHECDVPPAAATKPTVVRTTVDANLTSAELDRAVRVALREHRSLYTVDAEALRRAQPDLIITQTLCPVCAVDASVTAQALRVLPKPPDVVSLHPHTISEVLADFERLGRITGRSHEAKGLVRTLRERLDRVQRLVATRQRRRVVCLEWLEPPMASGHWVPEQVELAGGTEVLGRLGEPSRYVNWEDIARAQPDVVVLMPCGFSMERTRRELSVLSEVPAWRRLPAVRDHQVYLVDGPAYFNRSGPRLVDGVELLAGLLHPTCCEELIPSGSVEPVEVATGA